MNQCQLEARLPKRNFNVLVTFTCSEFCWLQKYRVPFKHRMNVQEGDVLGLHYTDPSSGDILSQESTGAPGRTLNPGQLSQVTYLPLSSCREYGKPLEYPEPLPDVRLLPAISAEVTGMCYRRCTKIELGSCSHTNWHIRMVSGCREAEKVSPFTFPTATNHSDKEICMEAFTLF